MLNTWGWIGVVALAALCACGDKGSTKDEPTGGDTDTDDTGTPADDPGASTADQQG